jgi:hypothetical protein
MSAEAKPSDGVTPRRRTIEARPMHSPAREAHTLQRGAGKSRTCGVRRTTPGRFASTSAIDEIEQ